MKCPKCRYTSFQYLESCRKCGHALAEQRAALGLYALVTGIVLAPYIGWGIIPWMVIYMLGFFYIAGLNLIQHSIEAS